MKPENVKTLGSAVLHWLCFQSHCGRDTLMSEHYLSQPIGEYLLYHHSGTLDSEVDHPNLNPDGRRGRPRQIDFCLNSREKNRLTAAFELKWVGDGTFDKQRIVDDLLRLEVLRNKEFQHVYRYFLVAGKSDNFNNRFQNAKVNVGNGQARTEFINEFLSFSDYDTKKIAITSLSPQQQTACKEFSNYYKSELPRRFITQKIYGESMGDFSLFIWRVKSDKRRKILYYPEQSS